jgi:hypothetical protein
MGIETSFHQQKGHMDIGARFQEPNYLTAKMVAFSSPTGFFFELDGGQPLIDLQYPV